MGHMKHRVHEYDIEQAGAPQRQLMVQCQDVGADHAGQDK